MRSLVLGLLLAFAVVVGSQERAFPQGVVQPGLPGGGVAQPIPPYRPPNANGQCVELIDEGIEPLFPRLNNNPNREPGTITREDRDVFTGVEAARVTPMQKYSPSILGWRFQIVEKPAQPRQFRFLRFAWKKIGGTGIMVQLHTNTNGWDQRFYAGKNVLGWQPAKSVAEKIPEQWELVTVDLFKEFGARMITGISLAPLDGEAALFDHIVLGRTTEDLDKVTEAALGKIKPEKALTEKEREVRWAELTGGDAPKAALALRGFLASAPAHVGFIREKLAGTPPTDIDTARVQKLIAALDAEEFDTRADATAELIKIGTPVIEAVREAGARAANDEVRFRCRVILTKLGVETVASRVSESARLSRAIRVLERAGNAEARKVLTEIAGKKLAPELAADAKAALPRMPKP